MDLNWTEYIGLAAGTFTTAAYLPQVYKTWRTKAVEDISLTMYWSLTLGIFLWLIYGICIRALAVILANGVSLALTLGILRLKIVYDRRRAAARQEALRASNR